MRSYLRQPKFPEYITMRARAFLGSVFSGVVFNYGHTTGIPGYRGKGNLIHEDGQRARIHYVTYGGENVILKLELEKT